MQAARGQEVDPVVSTSATVRLPALIFMLCGSVASDPAFARQLPAVALRQVAPLARVPGLVGRTYAAFEELLHHPADLPHACRTELTPAALLQALAEGLRELVDAVRQGNALADDAAALLRALRDLGHTALTTVNASPGARAALTPKLDNLAALADALPHEQVSAHPGTVIEHALWGIDLALSEAREAGAMGGPTLTLWRSDGVRQRLRLQTADSREALDMALALVREARDTTLAYGFTYCDPLALAAGEGDPTHALNAMAGRADVPGAVWLALPLRLDEDDDELHAVGRPRLLRNDGFNALLA